MKILVIKLGALGDMIMATAILRQLSADYREDELWLLTVPMFAPLFKDWPALKVHTLPRAGVVATFRTLRWLRGQRFARIYDLQSNDRTRLWCMLSGAPVCVGNHLRYPYTHHPPEPYIGQTHAFDRINEILVSGGHAAAAPRPYLPVSELARAHVQQWLAGYALGDRSFVLLHAGASRKHPAKRWPYYRELARAIEGRALRVVWLGGEEDAELNRSLAREIGIDATGQFSVAELAELGRHARFAVTNDSAPMHILSLAEIPIYGLFGPTDWRRTHALGQVSRVITLDCGVSRAACSPEAQRLTAIPPAMVLAKLHADALI